MPSQSRRARRGARSARVREQRRRQERRGRRRRGRATTEPSAVRAEQAHQRADHRDAGLDPGTILFVGQLGLDLARVLRVRFVPGGKAMKGLLGRSVATVLRLPNDGPIRRRDFEVTRLGSTSSAMTSPCSSSASRLSWISCAMT
jgi:hypothetical protein